MSRQTDAVPAREKLHHHGEHGRDGVRVQTHFRFFDDHPFEFVAARNLGGRQEVVEAKEQGDELPLAGGPNEIRQHRAVLAPQYDAPLHLRDFGPEFEAAEHMLGERLPQSLVEPVALGKQAARRGEVGLDELVQLLAESAQHGSPAR